MLCYPPPPKNILSRGTKVFLSLSITPRNEGFFCHDPQLVAGVFHSSTSPKMKIPNYQNVAVSNQLTDDGRGEKGFLGVTVNLLMCDGEVVVYSVNAMVIL